MKSILVALTISVTALCIVGVVVIVTFSRPNTTLNVVAPTNVIHSDAECRTVLADLLSQCDDSRTRAGYATHIDEMVKYEKCGSPAWMYDEEGMRLRACVEWSATARRLFEQLDAYWHEHKP